MANPGSITSQLPHGDDYLVREIQDIERTLRELEPSIARSFSGTVAKLNDAIASVIAPSFNQDGIGNYAISTTSTSRKSVTFTVPTGYTKALVMATASAMGMNGTATGDYLFVQANVNGISGGELYSYAGPGLAVGLSALLYWELTGLTGGNTFPVSVQTRTNANPWPASVSNQANIYALVLYLR